MSEQYDENYLTSLGRWVKATVVDVPDFPKKGVVFKDITPIFLDVDLFSSLVKTMAASVPKETTKIAAIDARGFLVAAPVAIQLQLPLAICRKPGKLPGEVRSVSYDLEYGSNELCMRPHSVMSGDRVFVIDDLLATGGTAKASADLVKELGGTVTGFGFLIELCFLNGRSTLTHSTVVTLTQYHSP